MSNCERRGLKMSCPVSGHLLLFAWRHRWNTEHDDLGYPFRVVVVSLDSQWDFCQTSLQTKLLVIPSFPVTGSS